MSDTTTRSVPTDHEHRDVQRRIKNILDAYPPAGKPGVIRWSLWESRALLELLNAIVRARQAHGGADDVGELSLQLDVLAGELQRLAAVMVCPDCDTTAGSGLAKAKPVTRCAATTPRFIGKIGPSSRLGGGPIRHLMP
jgi:hypothetical protein